MNISLKTKTSWIIRYFGITKVPMIWYCRPKVIQITDEILEVKIPLKRRTKNHLNSMYFGVLAVGADVTGGFLAMGPIMKSKRNIALLFKDSSAKFLKRAEGDVHFICRDGRAVAALVEKAIQTGERHELTLHIDASVPSISDEKVAEFTLTISLKDKTRG